MRGCWLLVLGTAACGRIAFDERIDERIDDASGDALTVIPAGVIAWYRAEDDPSDGAEDSSGNGHHATCETTCPQGEPGRDTLAFRFSGDLLRVPHADDLITTTFTVATWLRVDAAPSARQVIAGKLFAASYENSWSLALEPDLGVLFYTARPNDFQLSDRVLTAGTWHHVAITFDGTTKIIWFDAVAAGSTAADPPSFDTGDVVLGGDIDGGVSDFYLDALLDDVRIYDRALAQVEIATLAR